MSKLRLSFISALIFMSLIGCQTAIQAYTEASSQERVLDVQESLVALNYLDDRADGKLGPKTRAAIKKFQNDNGMVPDGEVSFALYNKAGLAATASRQPKPVFATVASGTQSSSRFAAPTSRSAVQTSSSDQVCDHAIWSGNTNNLADLFACDESRAISLFSGGHQVNFKIGSVSFSNGKLIATNYVETTPNSMARQRLQQGYSAADWFTVTQARTFEFTCILPGEKASSMKKGQTALVNMKLKSYSSGNGSFDCS